jgi:hypothetical protein
MKNNYLREISKIIFVLSVLCSDMANGQIVRLSTGFDNYIGSSATVPAGWHISWNSTSSPSYYFSAGNYGAAIPSYKFGVTQDTIISPHFLSGDTLSLWCKGQGAFSAQNVLSIYISEDSVSWNQIQNLDSLPVTATTFSFPLPCSAHYVMFVYFQVSGNLAFDDVKVTMTDYFPVAFISMWLPYACDGDSFCFGDITTIGGCDSIVSRLWDFGDSTATDSSQSPCHIYSGPGIYTVQLIVTASNGNSDTATAVIAIEPNPVAQFTYNNVSGNLVDLTDLSTISSGSIASWYWSFGDSTFSIQHNPSHVYPATGMYHTCLMVSSSNGCSDTFCDSVNVIGVGMEEHDFSEEISVSPIPARNQLTVSIAMHRGKSAIENVTIFDLIGQQIMYPQSFAAGSESLTMDVSQLESGIYFLRIKSGEKVFSRKMVIEK